MHGSATKGDLRGVTATAPGLAGRIGTILKRARERQGLSQAQVARLAARRSITLSRAEVSAVECGRHLPGMEALIGLCRVLYVEVETVLEHVDRARATPSGLEQLGSGELDTRGLQLFRRGEFRQALHHWDLAARRLGEQTTADSRRLRRRRAALELRRASALRRCGALLSGRRAAERAIALGDEDPATQSKAYVADTSVLQLLGCLTLAGDMAERAVEVSSNGSIEDHALAWNALAGTLFAAGRYEEAQAAYARTERSLQRVGDGRGETVALGNIGLCLARRGRARTARSRLLEAVERCRRLTDVVSEAHWLICLGQLALERGELDRAVDYAEAAVRLARPREHHLTLFRGAWLRFNSERRRDPRNPDDRRHQLAHLRRLFWQVADHRDVREVAEYTRWIQRQPVALGAMGATG